MCKREKCVEIHESMIERETESEMEIYSREFA